MDRALLVVAAAALAGCNVPVPLDPTYDVGTACDPVPSQSAAPGLGWLQAILPSVRATEPTPPIQVEIEVCDAKAFFGAGSRTVVRLTAATQSLQHVTAGVNLPPGVTLVSGSLAFDGALGGTGFDPIQVHDLEGVLRGEPGRREITAWSEMADYGTYGSRSAPRHVIALQGDAESGRPVQPESQWSRFPSHASMVAEAADPSHVTATFSADVDWNGYAQFYADPPDDPQVPFALEAHQARQMTAIVDLPDDWVANDGGGVYQVHLYIYPDARLSGEVITVSKYYDVQDGRIVVLDEVPPG